MRKGIGSVFGLVALLYSTLGFSQECTDPITYGNFQTAKFDGISDDTNFVQKSLFTGQNFLADLNYITDYRADFEPTLNFVAATMSRMDLSPAATIINTAQFSNLQNLGYQSNTVGFLNQQLFCPMNICTDTIFYTAVQDFQAFLSGTESPVFEATLVTGILGVKESFTSTAHVSENNFQNVDYCQLSLQGVRLVECTRSAGISPNNPNLLLFDFPISAVYSSPVLDLVDTFVLGVNQEQPTAIMGRLVNYQVAPSGTYSQTAAIDFIEPITAIIHVDSERVAVVFPSGNVALIRVNADGTLEAEQEYEAAPSANYPPGYVADTAVYKTSPNQTRATFIVSGQKGTVTFEVDTGTFILVRPPNFSDLEPIIDAAPDVEFSNAQLVEDYDNCNGADYEVLSFSPSLNQSFHSVALAEGQLSAFTVNTTENDPLCPNGTLVTFNATYCNSFPTFAFNLSDQSGAVTMQTLDDSHLCVINTSGEGEQTLTITVAPTNLNGDPCGPVSDQFVVAVAPSGAIQMRGNCIANLNGTTCGPQAADAWLLLVPATLWVLRKRLRRA